MNIAENEALHDRPYEDQRKGAIKCPTCKNTISPDDRTEEAYTILRPIMKEDGLDRVVLQCNRCGNHINLTGFRFLDEIAQVDR